MPAQLLSTWVKMVAQPKSSGFVPSILILLSCLTVVTNAYLIISFFLFSVYIAVIRNFKFQFNDPSRILLIIYAIGIPGLIISFATTFEVRYFNGMLYIGYAVIASFYSALLSAQRGSHYVVHIGLIYLVTLSSGLAGLFFPDFGIGLGGVRTEHGFVRRNAALSSIEPTALALSIFFIYLTQYENKKFVIGAKFDALVAILVIGTTFSKSIVILACPVILMMPFGNRARILIIYLILLLVYLYYDYTSILLDSVVTYYLDNGLSSFLGRVAKWQNLVASFESTHYFFGHGLRAVNVASSYAGAHSYFVALFYEYGLIAIFVLPLSILIVICCLKMSIIGYYALFVYIMTFITSEVLFNKFFVLVLILLYWINRSARSAEAL